MPDEFFSKPCDVCGIRPAVLMFRTYNGDQFGDEGLCPQCAHDRFSQAGGMTGVNNPEVLESINEMRQILANIANHLRKMSENAPDALDTGIHGHNKEDVCSVCGHDSSEITRIGNMGCPACYEQFSPLVRERLAKFAYSAKYQGLVPLRYRKFHYELAELERLHTKLNALVRAEQYEQAAEIRKRILKLSGHS